MNPNNLQVFSDSENYQPSLASHYNPQDNDMLTVSPLGQETVHSNENADHVIYAQYRSPIDNNPQIQPIHPTVFIYRPPNNFYHYHINCKEISYDIVESLLKKLFNDKEDVPQLEMGI